MTGPSSRPGYDDVLDVDDRPRCELDANSGGVCQAVLRPNGSCPRCGGGVPVTGPSPRPTREQVHAALAHVDVHAMNASTLDVIVLAAEVRALRAELDAARKALDIRDRLIERAWDAVPEGLDADDDSLATHIRAALAARTPQPAEPNYLDDGVEVWIVPSSAGGLVVRRDATSRLEPTEYRIDDHEIDRAALRRLRDVLTAALTEET